MPWALSGSGRREEEDPGALLGPTTRRAARVRRAPSPCELPAQCSPPSRARQRRRRCRRRNPPPRVVRRIWGGLGRWCRRQRALGRMLGSLSPHASPLARGIYSHPTVQNAKARRDRQRMAHGSDGKLEVSFVVHVASRL
ncbi:unnamed protein product, partial [Urochloa decumbens]